MALSMPADDPAPTFADEWVARHYPFLESGDPHQECRRRAEVERVPIETMCHCSDGAVCTGPCCTGKGDQT